MEDILRHIKADEYSQAKDKVFEALKQKASAFITDYRQAAIKSIFEKEDEDESEDIEMDDEKDEKDSKSKKDDKDDKDEE